jgi:hypothetical protein
MFCIFPLKLVFIESKHIDDLICCLKFGSLFFLLLNSKLLTHVNKSVFRLEKIAHFLFEVAHVFCPVRLFIEVVIVLILKFSIIISKHLEILSTTWGFSRCHTDSSWCISIRIYILLSTSRSYSRCSSRNWLFLFF